MNKVIDSRLINFIEELQWLVKSYEDINLSEELARLNAKHHPEVQFMSAQPINPNIVTLAGILPSLFMNREFFPKNKDIAIFAEKVLGITAKFYYKRSQIELIGHIVCEVSKLEDSRLAIVAEELKATMPTTIKPRTATSEEWNEVIRRLLGEGSDHQ